VPGGGGAAHVDPSTIPLRELARFRGAMWTARMNLPFGPRPNQDDNCLAMPFIYLFTPEQQVAMIAEWKGRGYRHCCIGPPIGQGYHGVYPDYSFVDQFDQWLDVLQMLWDHDIPPICWVKGDYWTIEDLEAHEYLFTTPRAQKLMRIVVPGGWEPHRETPSYTWRAWLEWGARVFPRSLRILHMVADHDAPGSGSEGYGNDELWANVIHLIHCWFVQSFAFEDPEKINPELGITAYQEWKNSYDPRVSGSYPDRFQQGYAGWPTWSAWGDDQPLVDVPAEFASYWIFWDAWRKESEARSWGDAAIAAGARAYMDGGTVAVP
jgi:hypothetical protein